MTRREFREQENERWDRIYRERFEDPDYYTRFLFPTPQSSLGHIMTPLNEGLNTISGPGAERTLREIIAGDMQRGFRAKRPKRPLAA